MQLGGHSLISTSLYQPLDMAHRYFVEPRAFATRSLEDVFRDGNRVARYRITSYNVCYTKLLRGAAAMVHCDAESAACTRSDFNEPIDAGLVERGERNNFV